jgi:outer membrane protein assembly factor BamB
MRLDLLKLYGCGLCCFVWLAGTACALAQVSTNDLPAVRNAVVDPDAEVNTWLIRAAAEMRAGNQDQALTWLLRGLQADPATLASTNGVTFRPARKLALELIRAIPERTWAAYRAQRDVARGAPGPSPAPTDPAALEARYHDAFASDRAETGLRLAGLRLDQQRFPEARRVLLDMEESALPRARRPEWLARLVVACARVGDSAQAQWAWDELQKEGAASRWPGIEAELGQAAAPATALASNAWLMAYGNASREGAPAMPRRELATNESWVMRWTLNLAPSLIYNELDDALSTNRVSGARFGRGTVVREMMERNRRPMDGIVFSGNRAWLNRRGAFAVVNLDTGRVERQTAHVADAPPPSASTSSRPVRAGRPLPSSGGGEPLWSSGNRLADTASLIGSRVYCVEDNDKSAIRINQRGGAGRIEGQPRGNTLAAYEAQTGQLLWRVGREVLPAAQDGTDGRWRVNAIRFLGSPVMCAGRLLASFDDGAGFGVVAFDANSGAVVWRTRVAFGSLANSLRLAPLTVDGTSVYVCDGRDQVSAFDAFDGSVLWATVYDSLAEPAVTNAPDADATSDPIADTQPADVVPASDRWEETLVVVAGDTVVALPEDSGDILGFDRRGGAPLWRRPKPEGVEYVVGRRGVALVVAGAKAMACVDVTDGRERWRQPTDGSTGRGVLRGREVLIPHGQRIGRWRIEDGTKLASMRAQTLDDLPLGNLYVHGDELLVAGLERLYALVGADAALAELGERIARQPAAETYAERGAMLAGVDRHLEALGDLREAWKRQRGAAGEDTARGRLLNGLSRAADQDPASAARCLAEMREIAGTDKERAEAAWRAAQSTERKGDTHAALSLYAAMLTTPDARIRLNPDWEVSSRLLAARRIRALLARDEAGLRALLEKPAEQALAQLGPQADRAALVGVATLFAGTVAGKAAAFQAAQAAAERGDFGIAATILNRTLMLSPASFRAEIAGELARLYERMKWPRGVARLREEWPRLGGGAPLPDFLAQASANAAPPAGSSQPPSPPWRLKWKKGPDLNCFLIAPSGALYSRSSSEGAARHIVYFGCLSLETGLPRWEKAGSSTFGMPGNVRSDFFSLFSNDRIQTREWDAGHLMPSGAGSVDVWSGAVVTYDPLFSSFESGLSANRTLPSALSEAGVVVVKNGNVLLATDMLTGTCIWMASVAVEAGTWISVESTMLAPDGSPSAFPLAGHFLALTSDRRLGVALDPLTGEELSRRFVDDPSFCIFWTRHAFGLRRVEREDKGLVVTDPSTGVTNWVSPPGIAIVRHQAMESGTVLVETDAGELLVLDGADGKVRSRSGDVRFDRTRDAGDRAFDSANTIGNLTVAERRVGDVKEIVALDVPAWTAVFQGAISKDDTPVAFFGPMPTNLCLVKRPCSARESLLKVVNEKGENVNGWTLPLPADRRYPDWCFANPFFTRNLIVLGCSGGDILAYEHDPGDGGKK